MKKIIKSLFLALSTVFLFSVASKAQTVEEGLRHLNAERYLKAGEVFNKLTTANPTAENYFELGRYYLNTADPTSNIKAAEEAFSKGNALDKNGNPISMIGLAWVKIAQKDFAGAKLILDDVFKKGKYAKDSELLYRAGEGYAIKGLPNDPAEAVSYINQALEVKKVDNPEYYMVLAKAYDIQNEGGDAMNALQNAIRFNPADKAYVYSFMSRIWLQGKNYKEAQDAFNNSIAADVEHAPAYRYQSSFHQTYQNWDKAAEAASNYLKYSDGDCGAKLRYSKIAFIAKDFDNVLKTLKEIESCNEDPIVHRLSGIAKFELGNSTEAINDLKTYLDKADKEEIFGLDYGFIGRAYLALDDEANVESNEKMAIEYMEKAIAMEDTTFDYYTTLGAHFQEKKDYPQAANFYKKAVDTKKKPDGQDYFRLGILQYQIQDWPNADESFDKVIESYKDTWAPPYILSARIKTYRNPEDTLYSYHERYQQYLDVLGDEGKANPQFKRDVADAYKYLAGRAMAVDKDIVKATALIDELLKYDPDNQEAIQLKNSINGIVPEEELLEDGVASPDSSKAAGVK